MGCGSSLAGASKGELSAKTPDDKQVLGKPLPKELSVGLDEKVPPPDKKRVHRNPRKLKEVYRLGKTLGTGGFAVVRCGVERDTGKEWAIKIMALPQGETKADQQARNEIYKEISLLAQIHHPNVLFLKEYFEESGKVFIVTELIRGGEFLQAVSDLGNYTERDARVAFQQVLNGIAYLHSKGIVHRDLKLENLMLGIPGNITQEVKIVDFGLAKKATESAMRTVCGTPMARNFRAQYVAPEVVNCIPGLMYGEAVDLWSAGVILFMLLSGYPPFHDDSDPVLFEKIRKGRFDFDDEVWTHVSPDAKDLIKKLLVVDPRKRLTAVEALKHQWFKADLGTRGSLAGAHDRIKGLRKGKFKGAVDAVMAVNRMKHALMMLSLPPVPPNAPGGSITDSRRMGMLEDTFFDETFGTREDAKDAMGQAAQYVRFHQLQQGPEGAAPGRPSQNGPPKANGGGEQH